MEILQEKNYIAIRNSQINYYRDVALYYVEGGAFVLYKPPGQLITELRLNEKMHPKPLYIHQNDRITAVKELQKEFHRQIAQNIQTGNTVAVKSTLCSLVEEAAR